jgi:hypothetical protein
MIDHEAFPLAWPIEWPRTKARDRLRSRYRVKFTAARDQMRKELSRHAIEVVVSTNIPLRRDGLPYANQREPEDPGVAVYWTRQDNIPMVLACDTWETVRENIRAIGVSIVALHTIERAGATEVLNRAWQGFKALPAAGETGKGLVVRTPRMVLGLPDNTTLYRSHLKQAYRKKVFEVHQAHLFENWKGDTNPNRRFESENECLVELNLAYEQLKNEAKL